MTALRVAEVKHVVEVTLDFLWSDVPGLRARYAEKLCGEARQEHWRAPLEYIVGAHPGGERRQRRRS